MPSVFTPERSPLDLVFSDRTTYIIPPYQRPYSWQAIGKSDQNNQVNQMWDDLWGFFMANRSNGKEYFLGSMVVIDKGQRCFEVIDGQQRLTTLLLMFGAMRCFIKQCDLEPADVPSLWDPEKFRGRAEQNVERFLFNSTSVSITAEPKVRIQRDGGQNFDAVLKAVLNCDSALPTAEDRSQDIARRYLLNFQYFESKFRENFLVDKRMSRHHATELNEFSAFLFQRVALVRITTADFDTAYSIFEILNNRGLPLSGRDLLRNFMLKELTDAKIPEAARKWAELERDYVLTEDFIGRFVESRKATQQRYSAFNDMVDSYKSEPLPPPGKSKAEIFYERIREDLNRYSLIVEASQRIHEPAISNRVQLALESGNARYSVNLLLALFRHFNYVGGPNAEIVRFLRGYQAYLFYGSPVGLVGAVWGDVGGVQVQSTAAQEDHADEARGVVKAVGTLGDRADLVVHAFGSPVVEAGTDVLENPIHVLANRAGDSHEWCQE